VATRTGFQDITASCGKRAKYYLDGERLDQTLTDLSDRVGDRRLAQALRDLAKNWKSAFALSPPNRVRLYAAGLPTSPVYVRQDVDDGQRLSRQFEVAHEGLDVVAEALRNLNALERKTR